MSKRLSYEADEQRIAETLQTQYGSSIQDKDSFDVAYEDYLGQENEHLVTDSTFRGGVFDEYTIIRREMGSPIEQKRKFKDAEGKDLRRDRQTDSKTIVKTQQEYEKRGAKNVDLKGYDTKKGRFGTTGRIRGKTVIAERVTVLVKGKQQIRFRDRKGRFVSGRK